jgi:hypothetical protein
VIGVGLAVAGGVVAPAIASAAPHVPTVAATSSNPIVADAQAIANGDAEPGWGGGHVPYAWGGGHGGSPGPSLGTCAGYTGPSPCEADQT